MILTIAGRNIKLFFRDKSSIFFSFLAVLIIIGLYALFLGDAYSSGFQNMPGTNFLINSWVMAGILAVTSVTTTMGAFGVMVEDRAKKVLKDFYASPVKRSDLAAGYILSSYVIGVMMTLATFVLAELYIVLKGGQLLDLSSLVKLLGLTLLSVLSSSSMVFFLVTFFKSQNAFATASTIIGSIIGFLTGMYVPVGNLPAAVQTLIKFFPLSYSAGLFRQLLLAKPMAISFAGAPADIIASFNHSMGVTYAINGSDVSTGTSILILIGTGILFYGLSVINISRKPRE